MTLVVNLFGGPGIGKSTAAAYIFSNLKLKGINAELVGEYAKDKVWEENYLVLKNQFYVTAKQYHKVFRTLGKVDVVVTDSPFLLGVLYDPEKNLLLKKYLHGQHKKMNNYNILLQRELPYNNEGRVHDEKNAKNLDGTLLKLLNELKIDYTPSRPNKNSLNKICKKIEEKIN